ncbi:copper transporter [Brevibacterium daeguense]|uniref:Copper transporter n=1 Tax=Brevibacterium daeguense TaxID=909936 RepID=A0ABP8EMK1_9MICO
MIDFRYHLVSLISVFLALAVGIVLGAGPLKEPIGDSLQSQVEALRSDRDGLRVELEAAQGDAERLSEYVVASAPELLADTLPDTSVTLVAGPGGSADTVTALKDRFEESGASIATELQLSENALDPTDSAELLESLREVDPTLPAGDGDALVQALTKALAAGTGQEPGGPAATGEPTDDSAEAPGTPPAEDASEGYSQDQAAQVIEVLSAAGRISGGRYSAADSVVLVAPVVPDPPADGQPTATPTPESAEQDTAYVDLSTGLAQRIPTVVTGTTASAERGLVAALREAESAVSTVDGLELAAGPVITAVTVEETIAGSPGAFGFAGNAQAVLPGVQE